MIMIIIIIIITSGGEVARVALKLQNTLPLICMSLNKNSIYCVMLRSSKNAVYTQNSD